MAKLEGVKTLDMVNGEITKVAYGGAEYVKTDSPVQEGDIFLLTEGHLVIGGDTGAFYMANKRPGGGIEIPTMYRGNASAVQKNGNGIAFRKVDAAINQSVEERVAKAEGEIESLKSDVAALKGAAEPKPERLKVGDYAKVVGNSNGFSETGSIVKITVDDGSECPFKITFLNGEYAGWCREESLVRATDEEVAEAKRAAKWAEIGREVGEYKVGDVVRYDYGDNEICEVVDDTEDGRVGVQTKDYGICREKPDTLRLITPVEARFDR